MWTAHEYGGNRSRPSSPRGTTDVRSGTKPGGGGTYDGGSRSSIIDCERERPIVSVGRTRFADGLGDAMGSGAASTSTADESTSDMADGWTGVPREGEASGVRNSISDRVRPRVIDGRVLTIGRGVIAPVRSALARRGMSKYDDPPARCDDPGVTSAAAGVGVPPSNAVQPSATGLLLATTPARASVRGAGGDNGAIANGVLGAVGESRGDERASANSSRTPGDSCSLPDPSSSVSGSCSGVSTSESTNGGSTVAGNSSAEGDQAGGAAEVGAGPGDDG